MPPVHLPAVTVPAEAVQLAAAPEPVSVKLTVPATVWSQMVVPPEFAPTKCSATEAEVRAPVVKATFFP